MTARRIATSVIVALLTCVGPEAAPVPASGAEAIVEPTLALRSVRAVTSDGLRFFRAELLGVPAGSTVRVRCLSGCSLREQIEVPGNTAALRLRSLEGVTLKIGARVAFDVERPSEVEGQRLSVRRLVHAVVREGSGVSFPRRSISCRDDRYGSLRTVTCPAGAEFPVAAGASSIVVGGGYVWVSSILRNRVTQYDASSGRKLRTIPVRRPDITGLSSGRLILTSDDDRVVTITPRTARVEQIFDAGDGQVLDATVEGGSVYVSRPEGILVLDARSGALRRTLPHGCSNPPYGMRVSAARLVFTCLELAGGAPVYESFVADLRALGVPQARGSSYIWLAAGYGRALAPATLQRDGRFRLLDLEDGTERVVRLRRTDGLALIDVRYGVFSRKHLWLLDGRSNSVWLFSAAGRPIVRIPAGESPGGFIVRDGILWLLNQGSGTVSRVDMRRYVGSESTSLST